MVCCRLLLMPVTFSMRYYIFSMWNWSNSRLLSYFCDLETVSCSFSFGSATLLLLYFLQNTDSSPFSDSFLGVNLFSLINGLCEYEDIVPWLPDIFVLTLGLRNCLVFFFWWDCRRAFFLCINSSSSWEYLICVRSGCGISSDSPGSMLSYEIFNSFKACCFLSAAWWSLLPSSAWCLAKRAEPLLLYLLPLLPCSMLLLMGLTTDFLNWWLPLPSLLSLDLMPFLYIEAPLLNVLLYGLCRSCVFSKLSSCTFYCFLSFGGT